VLHYRNIGALGLFAFLPIIAAALPRTAAAQGFYCNYGQPACVDPRPMIFNPGAVCVDHSALCLVRGQCDDRGFTCKSSFDDCVVRHDRVVDDYNSLLADLDRLSVAYDDLVAKHDSLIKEHLELIETHNQMIDNFGAAAKQSIDDLIAKDSAIMAAEAFGKLQADAVRRCVAAAAGLSAAKDC
jgi:hypothetical protein